MSDRGTFQDHISDIYIIATGLPFDAGAIPLLKKKIYLTMADLNVDLRVSPLSNIKKGQFKSAAKELVSTPNGYFYILYTLSYHVSAILEQAIPMINGDKENIKYDQMVATLCALLNTVKIIEVAQTLQVETVEEVQDNEVEQAIEDSGDVQVSEPV